MTDQLRPLFWQEYTIDELNPLEWEALCDGCGLCCLVKLEDEDTNEIVYTKVACHLLDCKTAQCKDYPNRKKHVPDCIQLTPELLRQINWLPPSCAYRRVKEGKPLPTWHYLLTGDKETVRKTRKSAAGRCLSENNIDPDDIERYIVRWVR